MIRIPIFICIALALVGCQDKASAPGDGARTQALEASYLAPPTISGVRPVGDKVLLAGQAAPGATVRLATPEGQVIQSQADDKGLWRLAPPASGEAAIYGLSQKVGGRTVQAEGYLLITPGARAALLRAGGAALILADEDKLGLRAFDVDRDGGAVVSGRGQPGSRVNVGVDGKSMGQGKVSATGEFAVALSGPVPPGQHKLRLFGDDLQVNVAIDTRTLPPLTSTAFRAVETPLGMRVDWLTPGGGVQTTLLFRPDPAVTKP